LFPGVHSQRSYVFVEEEFKRRYSRTLMLLPRGKTSTLKPKVTYYEILREDGEYKLLVELTMWLSNHKHA
jgi:hypothetical protein